MSNSLLGFRVKAVTGSRRTSSPVAPPQGCIYKYVFWVAAGCREQLEVAVLRHSPSQLQRKQGTLSSAVCGVKLSLPMRRLSITVSVT